MVMAPRRVDVAHDGAHSISPSGSHMEKGIVDIAHDSQADSSPPKQTADSTQHRKLAYGLLAIFMLLIVMSSMYDPPPATAATAAAAAAGKGPLELALAKAFRGGLGGVAGGVVQVMTFMWLRTAMNYQYANGGGLMEALNALWRENGIRRLYQGWSFAIVQAPLSRFGDTFANAGVLAVFSIYYGEGVNVGIASFLASGAGSLFKVALMPIDAYKTTFQVRGPQAAAILMSRVRSNGVGELYSGLFANLAANWVGSYPWFLTYNFCQTHLFVGMGDASSSSSSSASTALLLLSPGLLVLVRDALSGICASAVSDTCSNSLRVIKAYKQTSLEANLRYDQVVRRIVFERGLGGLFTSGLGTRVLVNCMQGACFSIVWKAVERGLV